MKALFLAEICLASIIKDVISGKTQQHEEKLIHTH